MRAPILSLSLALAVSSFARVASAQVELPRAVPTAKVSQQVGLTEVGVEYDCPAVKGRKIWGGVVPFGQVWLTGASAATKIKFSKDVTIGDRTVPAGSYWLLAVPNKDSWTLAVNKSADSMVSARDYKPELDVARVRVTPKATSRRERLTYTFSELTDDRASLDLEWDSLRVSLPIQANTSSQVQAAINGLEGTWRSYANAARYMLETKKDYDAGLKYIDQALALRDDWYSMWVKGALLAAKGDFGSAHDWAEKAHTLALQVGNAGGLEPELNRSIAEWGRRSGRVVNVATQPKLGERPGDKPSERGGEKIADDSTAKTAPAPTTPPAFKSASDTLTAPALEPPVGDPPVMRRARLRHR
jgi:Protein of unknown function (DUF2911)